MRKILSFTLTELIITMAIAAILAGFGISGYMDYLRVERRKDAILSLKKAALIIVNSNPASSIPCVKSSSSSTPKYYAISGMDCTSDSGFYYINYQNTGFSTTITSITNNLIGGGTGDERLYLMATADPNGPQNSDVSGCRKIYLTNYNNLHPIECIP